MLPFWRRLLAEAKPSPRTPFRQLERDRSLVPSYWLYTSRYLTDQQVLALSIRGFG